jgi:hypothetical protein
LPINLSLDANGARIVSTSSTRTSSTTDYSAARAIDGDLRTGWQSAAGKISNESITVELAAHQTYSVTGVVVDPSAIGGEPAANAVKRFEIDLSTDGTHFHAALTAETTSQHGLQTFNFATPTNAAFARFVGLSNWGGVDGIALSELEVVGLSTPILQGASVGNKLGLVGCWTYFEDTRTLSVEIGTSPGSGVVASVTSLVVRGLPVADRVTYSSIGDLSITTHIPRVNMQALEPLYLPYRQGFGFEAQPIPPNALPDNAVLPATVQTSDGTVKLKLREAPRHGEWTLTGKTLYFDMTSPTVHAPATKATSLVVPIQRAGRVQDGLYGGVHGTQTPTSYFVRFPAGVPAYDRFFLRVSGPDLFPRYDLAYLVGQTGVFPIPLRQSGKYFDVYGDRVNSTVTYTYTNSSGACPSSVHSGTTRAVQQILGFGDGSSNVSQESAFNASGTVNSRGQIVAYGLQGSLSASWTAHLNPAGEGSGIQNLSGGGCTAKATFKVAPASVDASATGTLTATRSTLTMDSLTPSTDTSSTLTFVNRGSSAAAVALVQINGDRQALRIIGGTCARGLTVAPHGSCTIRLQYVPHTSLGARGAIVISTAGGPPTSAAVTSVDGAPPKGPNSVGTAVSTLVVAINRDRQLHGSPQVVLNPKESACSLAHSKYMASVGRLTHQGYPHDICVPHHVAVENLGSSRLRPLVGAVLKIERAMIAEGPCPSHPCSSSQFSLHSHYEQLIDPRVTMVGIGIYIDRGTAWLTEDLFNP